MSIQEDFDRLEDAIYDVSQGISALEVVSLGLAHAHDPYTDGFNALYNSLFEASQRMRMCMKACMEELQHLSSNKVFFQNYYD